MSSAPAAIDGLLAALRAAPVLEDVTIVDGQPLQLDPDMICVGYSPDRMGVESDETPAGLQSGRESYGITCLASAWRGEETDPKAVRDIAFGMVAKVRAELARDPKLGGAVVNARLEFLDLDQEQTQSGPSATIQFVVRCQAFTN